MATLVRRGEVVAPTAPVLLLRFQPEFVGYAPEIVSLTVNVMLCVLR